MIGQRGLAWRGDDPEGLKTYTVYTQSTHTPADCTQARDSVIPAQNTLTKYSCTTGEEIKASTAVRSESSEVDSGKYVQSLVLPTSGEILGKSRSPLETAASIARTHAYTLSHHSVTSAESTEA